MNLKKIMLIIAFFTLPFIANAADEVSLEGIKVNLIGKKTRVSFLFSHEVNYTMNKLENPFRLMLDFREDVKSHFDKVKVFNMGYVRNVRSFFLEEELNKGAYILDACVVELDTGFM